LPPETDILVFEPEHAGHQPAFVRMLAEHLQGHPSGARVTFAVPRALIRRIVDEDAVELPREGQVRFQELPEPAVRACTQGSAAAQARARWRTCGEAAREAGARHGHFLYFDHMQLPLAMPWLTGGPESVSGILFRPSVHPIYATGKVPLAERIRESRKRRLYARMLRNPRVTAVLSLDPWFAEYANDRLGAGGKVRTLPDPVVSTNAVATPPPECDPQRAPRAAATHFLLFGALSERKGVLQVVDALRRVPESQRVLVTLAGRMDEPTRAAVQQRVARHPELARRLRVVDRFLTTAELEWMVQDSDVVLAPYLRFVGSSGTLIWAAAHRKPVLAQDYGLVGALTRQYELGVTADTGDADAIARAMTLLADDVERAGRKGRMQAEKFLEGRTASDFAQSWLDALLPHCRAR
jgi:glycosyltransferase involved in cell wall biosynthesis